MSTAVTTIRKLARLSVAEWGWLLHALYWLPRTSFLLKSRGYRETMRMYAKIERNPISFTRAESIALGRKIARMIDVASRYGITRGTCLSRSMVLVRMLAEKDLRAELKFAANLGEENFAAHAWVELDGEIINDRANIDSAFSRFGTKPIHD